VELQNNTNKPWEEPFWASTSFKSELSPKRDAASPARLMLTSVKALMRRSACECEQVHKLFRLRLHKCMLHARYCESASEVCSWTAAAWRTGSCTPVLPVAVAVLQAVCPDKHNVLVSKQSCQTYPKDRRPSCACGLYPSRSTGPASSRLSTTKQLAVLFAGTHAGPSLHAKWSLSDHGAGGGCPWCFTSDVISALRFMFALKSSCMWEAGKRERVRDGMSCAARGTFIKLQTGVSGQVFKGASGKALRFPAQTYKSTKWTSTSCSSCSCCCDSFSILGFLAEDLGVSFCVSSARWKCLDTALGRIGVTSKWFTGHFHLAEDTQNDTPKGQAEADVQALSRMPSHSLVSLVTCNAL